jgi:hypothetical protein
LIAAGELFIDAGLFDEAARVLLLRADGESELDKRLALCDAAARVAKSPEARRRALARKGRLGLDLLRAGGALHAREELRRVARELEEAGELNGAAEAYRLAGDDEGEIRMLTEAGAIDELEQRLDAQGKVDRRGRERQQIVRRIRDLDRTAERRSALDLAAQWLAAHDDDEVRSLAQTIHQRLLRGPLVDLEIEGAVGRWVFGDEVTLGRGNASVRVHSPAISREHLRLFVGPSGPAVEDLSTHNGTLLGGVPVVGATAVGRGLHLLLGGEVPCTITPERQAPAVVIEVAGQRVFAPLGELCVGPWRLQSSAFEGVSLVQLHTPRGAPRLVFGELELAERVELSVGDAVSAGRAEPPWLRVPAQRGP